MCAPPAGSCRSYTSRTRSSHAAVNAGSRPDGEVIITFWPSRRAARESAEVKRMRDEKPSVDVDEEFITFLESRLVRQKCIR